MRPWFQTRLLSLGLTAFVSAGLLGGGVSLAAPFPGATPPAAAQDGAAPNDASAPGAASAAQAVHGKLLLVLPFENDSKQPNLDWISEAFPAILNRRLGSAGFMPISRDDRLYSLEHLGLPQSFQPSRASTIRLAQTLDADDVIVGSFSTDGPRFLASARVLNVDTLHLSLPIAEEADIARLLDVLNNLAWRVAKQLDPQFAVSQKTFAAADPDLTVAAFENYVRGLVEPNPEDQVRHLKEAVRLVPSYAPSLFALGNAYFANQQYDLAALTFGRLPADDPNAREADFYRGLAYLYIGSYVKAEDAFAFVSGQLPLPEVVNDQGVAASRRGKDGTALFLQAVAGDPTDEDYRFNLAVALYRKNDVTGALAAIAQALKLQPQDADAQAFQSTLRARAGHPVTDGKTAPSATGRNAASSADDPQSDTIPLERVKRTFNEASFRQAATELEQVEALRLSSLPPAQRAEKLTEEGTRFLYQGLILEAEREFQAALEADNSNPLAHAGLAMVREKVGDAETARSEATQSLALKPNITGYLVLARLDIAANELPAAAGQVSQALKLEPQNSAAQTLRQELEAKGQQIP